MIHIGIDTSNYKTSLAAVDDSGRILANISEYLDVQRGEKGLRQSDAFFKHSYKLPDLLSQLLSEIDKNEIADISVSSRPRRVEGSYMPCFRAGINMANTISDILDIPVYEFSHQEGHAAAILESSDDVPSEPVILMHLSGGTTEFLKCETDANGYEMNIIGGTLDISFGQLLDRFGVALGMPFPAGKYIDALASNYKGYEAPGIVPGIRILDGYFNLSGPETKLLEFAMNYQSGLGADENTDNSSIDYNDNVASVSYELMDRIADILVKSADILSTEYKIDKVYMAGGVASSETIRRLARDKQNNHSYNIIFGEPALSGDNAVGTALLGRRTHIEQGL